MATRSGNGRTSSRLAKENRSRATEREGKAYSSKGAGPKAEGEAGARRSRVKGDADAERGSTATCQCRRPPSIRQAPIAGANCGQGKERTARGQGPRVRTCGGKARFPPLSTAGWAAWAAT